jgi:hypothetical protein
VQNFGESTKRSTAFCHPTDSLIFDSQWDHKWEAEDRISDLEKEGYAAMVNTEYSSTSDRWYFRVYQFPREELFSTNRSTATGSQRDNRSGKGRFDLLPPTVELLLAQALERGAEKYDERNWELGQNLSWYYDSGRRHLTQWWEGQRDEDHLLSACVNLMMALHTREMIQRGNLPESLDDTPDYTSQGHESNQPS